VLEGREVKIWLRLLIKSSDWQLRDEEGFGRAKERMGD